MEVRGHWRIAYILRFFWRIFFLAIFGMLGPLGTFVNIFICKALRVVQFKELLYVLKKEIMRYLNANVFNLTLKKKCFTFLWNAWIYEHLRLRDYQIQFSFVIYTHVLCVQCLNCVTFFNIGLHNYSQVFLVSASPWVYVSIGTGVPIGACVHISVFYPITRMFLSITITIITPPGIASPWQR